MDGDNSRESVDDLIDAVSGRKFATRHVQHLFDIVTGESGPLEEYYGEEAGGFADKEDLARRLIPRYADPVKQALELRDSHFQSSINRTAVVDFFVDEGVSPAALEDLSGKDFLLVAFDEFYDPNEGGIPETQVDRLVARGTGFEDRKDRTYRYEKETISVVDIEDRVEQFRRSYGNQGQHFDIRVYQDAEREQVALHLFRERPRQTTYRFEPRVEEEDDDVFATDPARVTTTPVFPVKAIKIRVRNTEDGVVLSVTKSPDGGWKTDIEALMKSVFDISKALSDEYQHTSETIDEIISGSIDVAQRAQEDETEEEQPEVDDWLDEKLETTAEERLKQLANDDDIDEGEVEQIREISETFTPVGLRYEEGDVIRSFDLTADPTLGDVMEQRLGARDLFTDLLSAADSDATVGIECRANPPNGNVETFVMQDGMWLPDGRLSRDLRNALDKLYDDDTDNE